jgi:hypothetical protein
VVVPGYGLYTVEVPAQNMLVARGGRDSKDIVAVFPRSTRLLMSDGRLSNTDVLPYWRWAFDVTHVTNAFRYGVTFSIMGSPEEGLKYRDKAQANWHRPDLNEWATRMLVRFEADTSDRWETYRMPLTSEEQDAFRKALMSWFERSAFSNQGIHIEHVVFDVPDLAH